MPRAAPLTAVSPHVLRRLQASGPPSSSRSAESSRCACCRQCASWSWRAPRAASSSLAWPSSSLRSRPPTASPSSATPFQCGALTPWVRVGWWVTAGAHLPRLPPRTAPRQRSAAVPANPALTAFPLQRASPPRSPLPTLEWCVGMGVGMRGARGALVFPTHSPRPSLPLRPSNPPTTHKQTTQYLQAMLMPLLGEMSPGAKGAAAPRARPRRLPCWAPRCGELPLPVGGAVCVHAQTPRSPGSALHVPGKRPRHRSPACPCLPRAPRRPRTCPSPPPACSTYLISGFFGAAMYGDQTAANALENEWLPGVGTVVLNMWGYAPARGCGQGAGQRAAAPAASHTLTPCPALPCPALPCAAAWCRSISSSPCRRLSSPASTPVRCSGHLPSVGGNSRHAAYNNGAVPQPFPPRTDPMPLQFETGWRWPLAAARATCPALFPSSSGAAAAAGQRCRPPRSPHCCHARAAPPVRRATAAAPCWS